MGSLREIGLMVAGVLLRIGVPLAVTVLFAWLLRKLDERWQHKAAAQKVGMRVARFPGVVEKCWEAKDCPPGKRDKCPAYDNPETPCWQVFRGKDRLLRENCLGCAIFRRAPVGLPA
jgi:hypothetical protein